MRSIRPQALLLTVVALVALHSGCTSFDAWRRCGNSGCPADQPITAEVTRRLSEHPALNPPNEVYVRTADGVVFLSGQVDTGMQRDVAESVARSVPGVRQVVDSIVPNYAGR